VRRKIRAYLADLERRGLSWGHRYAQAGALREFARGGFSVERFRALAVRKRPHVARAMVGALRAFLRFLGRQGEAQAIPLPPVPDVPPLRPPSGEEVRLLMLRRDGRTPVSLRDRAMMELIYSSGLRSCEVMRLELSDVDRRCGR
jgi:site-specific recombinase XerC